MLGKLSGKDESDRSLDLSRGDGRLLVVRSELGGLAGDALKDVVDEGVEDGHGLVGDTSVGVDLFICSSGREETRQRRMMKVSQQEQNKEKGGREGKGRVKKK